MNKQEIDKNFIDYLRLNRSTTNWIFDRAEKNEIVPKELTHGYLLANFNIDESIYKYYHLPTSKFLSDKEFQKMKDGGFAGNKETALQPYSNIIYGAYYSRSDLYTKLTMLVYSKRDYTIRGKKIKYFADLIPYFKEYAKGFENGFNEFDNSQIKPFLTMLAEKQDYVNKVFEFVTKQILFSHSWATLQTGFASNQNNEIVEAFENGQKQGYFYKAWSIIFSNHKLFAPLFQELLKALPPQQKGTDQETITFTNNFDNIKPTEIYKHFKAGLVEKGYLTEQELNEYLKAAFELKTKPETLFKLKHTPTKQKIYTVFYVYYKDISQKKHERQKEYAALLGDFFEGYKTEIIQTNWARDYKTKR